MSTKALVLSGGASKGAYTAGVVKYFLREKQMDFKLAIGTSTGSLVGGPALLGDYTYLGNVYTSVHNSNIFTNSPFGKLVNIFVNAGPIAASLQPLKNTLLDYYITDSKLQALIAAGKEFVVTIVNVRAGETVYVSSDQVKAGTIKDITFVKAIVASCSEPVFTEPIQVFEYEPNSPMKNDLFYDGGVREFMPFEHAAVQGADEIWGVSTHPLKIKPTPWGGTTSPGNVNLLKALAWTIGAALSEVERDDLFRAYAYNRQNWTRRQIEAIAIQPAISLADRARLLKACDDMFPGGMKLAKLFIVTPASEMPTSMEFDPAIMATYFNQGALAAEKFFQNGAPEFVDSGWLRPPLV